MGKYYIIYQKYFALYLGLTVIMGYVIIPLTGDALVSTGTWRLKLQVGGTR